MPHLVRPHSYTQYIRIFVIVNLTSFLVTRSALESYYNSQARKLIAQNPDKYKPKPAQARQSRPRHPAEPPYLQKVDMAPKKENTKKVAGNAKKAEAAAQKAAAADAAQERNEASKWDTGAKSNKKAADAAEKKAQAAAAKAERERLLAEEEKNQPAKPKSAGAKKAEKKTNAVSKGTLNLDQLDEGEPKSRKEQTINASGIDNALDALDLTTDKNAQAIERHPERRFKAAYKAYEERRLPEVEQEYPGLRRNQRVEVIRKEFEKSEENPFNQTGNISYDASKEDIATEKDRLRKGVEGRLAER